MHDAAAARLRDSLSRFPTLHLTILIHNLAPRANERAVCRWLQRLCQWELERRGGGSDPMPVPAEFIADEELATNAFFAGALVQAWRANKGTRMPAAPRFFEVIAGVLKSELASGEDHLCQ